MKIPKLTTRVLTTGAIVVAAVLTMWWLYVELVRHPWTRDGQVRAQIVMIAPRVTGVIVKVGVTDNQLVERGDLLFEIDPSDYALAVASASVELDQARQNVAAMEAAVVAAEAGVRQAEAGVTTAKAQIDSARAQVTSAEGKVAASEAGVEVAQAQIDEYQAKLEEAVRESDRAQRLAEDGAGSVESAESLAASVVAGEATILGARASEREARATTDQARADLEGQRASLASAEAGFAQAEAELATAHAQLEQARASLGEPGDDNVQVRAARVALDMAELDLAWTTVRAPSDGFVTNLQVDLGDYAMPGTPMLAFVDGASFYVQGYFRETQLANIEPGDAVTVTLMGHRDQPIQGTVESIGRAINPPDVATLEGTNGLVPQVEPSFDWIRLAQRVPVRIVLGEIPDGVALVSGTTASVAIDPED